MILTVIQYIPSTTLGNDPTYQVDFTIVDSLTTNYTLSILSMKLLVPVLFVSFFF